MCGIAAILGQDVVSPELRSMIAMQQHRGPDSGGAWVSSNAAVGLGHRRLSIIDLSADGQQPMANRRGDVRIVFNGEIYNYLELKRELADYGFQTQSDTEVILAAYERWGIGCVDRFLGMFAFVLVDERRDCAYAVRDRFGVKPLYYAEVGDKLYVASEISALQSVGLGCEPDAAAWAAYFRFGLYDHSGRTFWRGVRSLEPGCWMERRQGRNRVCRWYDLAARVGEELDQRDESVVAEEYYGLLRESMTLRFRSDVPVGVNVSGGLDSSLAMWLIDELCERQQTRAFTYVTGDERYDELPWVRRMLQGSQHPLTIVELTPKETPALAASVMSTQVEPFGGLPTLAYAKLHEVARREGVLVLIDGQGIDEQWAGYGYYANCVNEAEARGPVQGSKHASVRPDCLEPEFAALAEPFEAPRPFPDALRNRQYLDTVHAKIPRALRFNDRVSMRSSVELREPFLDHRLFELAFRQPADRKISNGVHKRLLRTIPVCLGAKQVAEAPKRPVQTPQREWLREELRDWTDQCIESALAGYGLGWLNPERTREAWREYQRGEVDNSFYIWQWLSLGLVVQSGVASNPLEIRWAQ